MAWSPYKRAVINYVSQHPGCSKWDVACAVTRSCLRCPSRQYYIVNTALRNGWIAGRMSGRKYRLYIPTAESERKVRERMLRIPGRKPSLAERLEKFKAHRLSERVQRWNASRTDGFFLEIARPVNGWSPANGSKLYLHRYGYHHGNFRSIEDVERSLPEIQAQLDRQQAERLAYEAQQAERLAYEAQQAERRERDYETACAATTPLHVRFNQQGGFSAN